MLKNGTVRIPTRMFLEKTSFFVSIIVMPNNATCSSARFNTENNNSTADMTPKRKLVSVKLKEVPMPSTDYLLLPILLPTVIIVAIVVGSAALLYFKLKILDCCGEDDTSSVDGPGTVAIVDTTVTVFNASYIISEEDNQANGAPSSTTEAEGIGYRLLIVLVVFSTRF